MEVHSWFGVSIFQEYGRAVQMGTLFQRRLVLAKV